MCQCYRNWMANDCSERVCQFGLAHVDTPKGDLDASSGKLTSPDVLVINNNDVYPHGTTEQYPSMYDSDQNVQTNTAHWYRECSNKGLCDRGTGTCTCFEGYEGSNCQRASCPITNGNVCSGHGVCKDIKALADDDNSNLYNLWDEHVTMGCQCDKGFTGPDCSQKQCKVGVDPLYVDGFQNTRYSNWTVQFFTRSTSEYVYGNYSIVFSDAYGEDWQTMPIDINANCLAITNALEALPNDVIPMGSVRCQKSEEHLHNKFAIDGQSTDTYNGQTNSNPQNPGSEDIYDSSIFLVTKYLIAFPMNPGYLKPPTINRYLDGSRPTLYTKSMPSTLGWHVFPNGFAGENVDYVSDECFGVLASIGSDSVSATHWLTGMDAPSMKRLKACLGDSNGVTTDNIETYNWDYGNWMNPHLIKLVEATQDTVTQYVRPDGTVYKVNDVMANNDGSVQDSQVIDFPVSKLCTNGRAWVTKKGAGNTYLQVTTTGSQGTSIGQATTNQLSEGFYNIGQQGFCMNINPPGFYAVIYFDDCSSQPTMNSRGYASGSPQATSFCSATNPFRILNRAGSDYSSNTKFHVYVTDGWLQQVNQNSGMFTSSIGYTAAERALAEHSNIVHFQNTTENWKVSSRGNLPTATMNPLTQDFVGQIDCETTTLGKYGALDCVDKGDMLMFLDLGIKDPIASSSATTATGAYRQTDLVTLYDYAPLGPYAATNLVSYVPAASNVGGLTQNKCFQGTNANGVTYGPYNVGTSSNPSYTCPNSGTYQPTRQSLMANPIYPNIYTVQKISRNPQVYGMNDGVYDREALTEPFRHTAILDFAVNGMFTNYPRAYQSYNAPASTATIYKFHPAMNTVAATYVGPCATRGICDHATGTCQCFHGYTNDDCSVLNALAH